jgi:hypothetical protein
MLAAMNLRFRRRSQALDHASVLETYTFPNRTVKVLRTADERIQWVCDCDKFRRWTTHKEPLWCKHIAKAAARRSIERLTRRVGGPRNIPH